MANAPRILIVTSRYYAHISAELEAGVVEGLEKVGATYEFLEVPGAFEIPAAIAMASPCSTPPVITAAASLPLPCSAMTGRSGPA